MVKQFNKERKRNPSASLEWPANPSRVPTLFSERKPLRMLRVLVDAELVQTTASRDTLNKSTLLLALLRSEVVEFYQYTNNLPPSDIEPSDTLSPSPYPVYAGWAVAYPREKEVGYWPVVYSTDPKRSYAVGGVYGNAVELAREDESHLVYATLEPEQRAERRKMDVLAFQVAEQALKADVFITQRSYLYSGSALISNADVTICTFDEAIPLIALYLRAQSEFILPTGTPDFRFHFNRGLYYWVGARKLLPEAWRWFGACVQHSSGVRDDKLMLLAGTLLSRVTKALQERDDVHFALNQPSNNDTSDKALSSLDNVLVSLLGAVDVTARVAHCVLKLPGREYEAAWQKKKWREQVAAKAPTLASIVQPSTPNEYPLTILRLLRNSVHGAALQGITYLLDGKAEMRIGLPAEDEVAILAAMDAKGGRISWGVHSIAQGFNHIQPGVLVDKLFEEVLGLLNSLMAETPVESLSHVTLTPDTSKPVVDNPSRGKFDTFSEWNRLAIRWQLGF